MSLPRISIITPTLNQRDFLEQTIHSVLSQNYPNLEYLIVDGGSEDGTVDLLKGCNDRFKWVSEPDQGQSDAINKGLAMASGDLIGILNSDDLYCAGALRGVGEFFNQHPQARWLTGRCRVIDQQGDEIRKMVTAYKNFWLRLNNLEVLNVLNYISQPATFIHRELVETVGQFDLSLKLAMDYDYWMRAKKFSRLYVVNHDLAQFRLYPKSKSGADFHSQFAEELQIAQRHCASNWLLSTHRLHKMMITTIYSLLKL